MSLAQADNLIALRRTGTNLQIPAGTIMADARHVTFSVPELTPPCLIGYTITMQKDGQLYGASVDIDVKIEPS